MKILALEKEVPGVTDDQFTEEILKAEARKAWELYRPATFPVRSCTSRQRRRRWFRSP